MINPSPKAEPTRPNARALFRRRDIRDEGICGNIHRTGHSCDSATDKQPGDRGRKTRQQVVEAIRKQRNQNDRTSSEAIAQIADDGTAEKLQHRVGHQNVSAGARRRCFVGFSHAQQQLRQHRHHDAEADRVDDAGDEDKY